MRKPLRSLLSGAGFIGMSLLGACNQPGASGNDTASNLAAGLPALPASLPLQAGPATSLSVAPSAEALPQAPRPALRRLADPGADYAYLDRAASYDDAIRDAPPDYGFDYEGVRPWGWQADDGSTEYAEPVAGGYRYYYYQPGAPTPYLVRDPGYSYAYDGLALVVVYDSAGRALPPGAYGPHWDYAGRYLERARALREAAAERRGVVAADWAARRAEIAASDASWDAARAQNATWAAYHADAAGRQEAHWQAERGARQAATLRFADYQSRGFQGPPPALDLPRPSWIDRLRFWQHGRGDRAAVQQSQRVASEDQQTALRQRSAMLRQQADLARAATQQAADRRIEDRRREVEQQQAAARRQAELQQQPRPADRRLSDSARAQAAAFQQRDMAQRDGQEPASRQPDAHRRQAGHQREVTAQAQGQAAAQREQEQRAAAQREQQAGRQQRMEAQRQQAQSEHQQQLDAQRRQEQSNRQHEQPAQRHEQGAQHRPPQEAALRPREPIRPHDPPPQPGPARHERDQH